VLTLRESNSAQLASAWRLECCDSSSNPGAHMFFCCPLHFAWACMPLFHRRGASFFRADGSWSCLARVSGCLIFLFRLRARMADGTRSFRMRRPTFELPVHHAELAYLCGNLLSLFSNAIYSLAFPALLAATTLPWTSCSPCTSTTTA
jgi:hypothetical protein